MCSAGLWLRAPHIAKLIFCSRGEQLHQSIDSGVLSAKRSQQKTLADRLNAPTVLTARASSEAAWSNVHCRVVAAPKWDFAVLSVCLACVRAKMGSCTRHQPPGKVKQLPKHHQPRSPAKQAAHCAQARAVKMKLMCNIEGGKASDSTVCYELLTAANFVLL